MTETHDFEDKIKSEPLNEWKSMRCYSTRTRVWKDEMSKKRKTCTTITGTEVFKGSAFHCCGCPYAGD